MRDRLTGWAVAFGPWALAGCRCISGRTTRIRGIVGSSRTRAYPALRENAIFLLDYMVRDPKSGHLITGPSCSPENAYVGPDGKSHNLCMGPTMDIEIVRAVFARVVEASEIMRDTAAVKGDDDLLARVRRAWSELPPFQIGHDGRLQEWQVDYVDHEPGHRHISHLFALFPEDQITAEGTPELARAARLVLDKRLAAGGGSTGWSRSWIINCMARLGDGEACYANILELFRQSTRPNLFDVCGLKENSPFQIDGNLGGPNGFIEMLLQCHGQTPLMPPVEDDAVPGEVTVRFLPALPKAWAGGSFRGLRARGGVEIDCAWSGGRAATATLRCNLGAKLRLVSPKEQSVAGVRSRGKLVQVEKRGSDALMVVQPGRTYEVTFA